MMTGFAPISFRKASRRSAMARAQDHLLVIFDVGEPLVAGRRPFERAALLGRAPGDEVLDLAREFEVLVGDPLGAVVLSFTSTHA